MRQLKATILLLLFIATFGRCFAEQYGVLGDNGLACCVEQAACCDDEEPAHHDEGTPPDCPICVIIDNNALLATLSLELPPPAFSSASSFFAIDAWSAEFLVLFRNHCDSGDDHIPPSPERLSLSLTELVLCSAPVRGPSVV